MADLLHELILHSADRAPRSNAILLKKEALDYQSLAQSIEKTASGLIDLGLQTNERVAICF